MGAIKNRLIDIAYELMELDPALSFEDAFSRVSWITVDDPKTIFDVIAYGYDVNCIENCAFSDICDVPGLTEYKAASCSSFETALEIAKKIHKSFVDSDGRANTIMLKHIVIAEDPIVNKQYLDSVINDVDKETTSIDFFTDDVKLESYCVTDGEYPIYARVFTYKKDETPN